MVLIWHHQAHMVIRGQGITLILLPQNTQEQGSRRRHYGDIWHSVALRKPRQRLDCFRKKWVSCNRAHGIVADPGWDCAAEPRWVLQHDVQATIASIIEVEVYAAEVVEHEIADGVGALNVVWIAVKSLEEFGVVVGDEGTREVVRPELEESALDSGLIIWEPKMKHIPCTRSPDASQCSSSDSLAIAPEYSRLCMSDG